jgi:serine/threonine protein kinase
MSDLTGKDLGRYHFSELIGEGGMASVYKAYDSLLERDVAIKVIRLSAFPPDELENILKRFEREGKVLAKLSHPSIVNVYDFGDYEGSPYLVMEYLPGGTLKKKLALLNGAAMPWKEAIQLLLPILEALEFAHGKNMVHRDLKPSNILITTTGRSMLSDFGIAKVLGSEDTSALTGSSIGMGTPEYMAPEQWTGKVLPQSDLYSMGVILYEMVTGRKPYEADTPAGILLKQATQPTPPPRKFSPDLPGGFETALLKVLATDPNDRYPNAAAFAQALKDLVENRKRKSKSPEKAQPAPVNMDDSRTMDHLSPDEPTLKSIQDRTAGESRPAAKPKPSLRGLWITLGSLSGVILVAALVGLFILRPKSNTLLPTATTALPVPTASAPAVQPTASLPPAEIPPTDTPQPTAAPEPTATKPIISRRPITVDNGAGLQQSQNIGSTKVTQIEWTPDNRYLVVASPNSVALYDTGSFSNVGNLGIPVHDNYLSNDGTLVAYLPITTSMEVQNVVDQSVVGTFPIPPHNGSITTVAFSLDNTLIAIGTSTGTIYIFQISDGKLVDTWDAPNSSVRTIAFSPDKKTFASGSGSAKSKDYSLRFWNLEEKKPTHFSTPHVSPITYLFYYPDGKIMASGSKDEIIRRWLIMGSDVQELVPAIRSQVFNAGGGIESLAFSQDSSLLAYIIPYQKAHALVLAQENGDVLKIIPNLSLRISSPDYSVSLAFSVDNTALALGDESSIRLYTVP